MRTILTVLLLLMAVPLAAQEREIRDANLPPDLERELLAMYEGGARRVEGPFTVARGEVVREPLAVTGGTLVVEGRVEADVAVVGGDVVVEPQGGITGRVTVVGGEVRLADGAHVGGTITAYGEAEERGRWSERDRDRDRDRWEDDRDDRYSDRGYSTLTLRPGSSYNRVEGLPVLFGPVFRTAGSNPLEVEALAIWRTESGDLDTDRMGYEVEAEQYLGGEREWSVGGSLFSRIDPMEPWQIRDLETSLSTFLFHDDLRDHFERTGWSAFAGARPLPWLEGRLEFRSEEHETAAPGDPWSVFDGDDVWRLQPVVAEGDLQILGGSLEVDLRDDEKDPDEGWYAMGRVERALTGDLERPAILAVQTDPTAPPLPTAVPATAFDTDFTTGLIDVRRYMPVGWNSQLNVRVVAGGSLSGERLPPQYQHALGGIGTLPGFDTFHGDCGARRAIGSFGGTAFHPAYGCDRFALGQVEYRGRLSIGLDLGEPDWDDDDWWDEVDFDLDPVWVAFFDVGRGWAEQDDPIEDYRLDTGTLYDVGLGLLLGDLGIYAALPLNDEVEQDVRFFLRLGRRF